jgi:hypothetical protein
MSTCNSDSRATASRFDRKIIATALLATHRFAGISSTCDLQISRTSLPPLPDFVSLFPCRRGEGFFICAYQRSSAAKGFSFFQSRQFLAIMAILAISLFSVPPW